MSDPSVSIIILNWNGWEDTIECLESIYHINYSNYQVIVVDNNSSDDSIQKINDYARGKLKVKSDFFKYDPTDKPIGIIRYNKKNSEIAKFSKGHKQLILIENKKNYGFAEGNNIGIEFALKNINPDYILLLNNDTVVDKCFLNILVLEGEKDAKIGLLGPKMYYYDNPDVIWCIGGNIDWKLARGLHIGIDETDIGQYPEKMNYDYINGYCLINGRNHINRCKCCMATSTRVERRNSHQTMHSCFTTKKSIGKFTNKFHYHRFYTGFVAFMEIKNF